MKVVYDVSVLGIGHRLPSARAGIFRVVEEVALGLHATGEVDLELCATESMDAFCYAHDYLRSGPPLAKVARMRAGMRSRLRIELQRQVESLSIQMEEARGVQRAVLRAARKPLYLGRERLTTTLLEWNRLARGADVFHSPFHALPARSAGDVDVQRFLTVYDLIPILFPHLSPDGQEARHRHILGSIREEDWVLCISESARDDLREYRPELDPERLIVTPLAADPVRFRPSVDGAGAAEVRRRYGIPDAPYLLSVCTLEPRKNLDHVIRAFATLVEQESLGDLRLVLVGSRGWKFEKIFEELGRFPWLRERVVMTGFVDDADLSAVYGGAEAFVYVPFYEGFGLPPLEAMQCGVPVITSNTSSLPEVVGTAGVMLDPTDLEGLCQAMLDAVSNPSLRGARVRAARERAALFSWDRTVELTLGAYRRSLATRGSVRA